SALNDVLISHKNPSAVSLYEIKAGRRAEIQKSSGLWISTAAGSTAGIASSGGKTLPFLSRDFEYRPRELCLANIAGYHLTGGVVHPGGIFRIRSMMDSGLAFIDGGRAVLRFAEGDVLEFVGSGTPLQLVDFKDRLLKYPRRPR
ncbi:MAG: hypothetical protein HQL11_05955, partial [Candidatus Omnitrophica bacterium]|nr:hypothetical protein [Candidatus Omnitrophota bacterium]